MDVFLKFVSIVRTDAGLISIKGIEVIGLLAVKELSFVSDEQ